MVAAVQLHRRLTELNREAVSVGLGAEPRPLREVLHARDVDVHAGLGRVECADARAVMAVEPSWRPRGSRARAIRCFFCHRHTAMALSSAVKVSRMSP